MELSQATPAQQVVIGLNKGSHLVLAPPGSGKTDLLALRLIDAIQEGVASDTMLCVTFTNRAARNMRTRVGEISEKPPFIGTLHTFGYGFLIANRLIPANTVLLDDEDARKMIEDSITAVEEDQRLKSGLTVAIALKYVQSFEENRMKLRGVSQPHAPSAFQDAVAEKSRMPSSACCAIDFDDILHLMLQSLQHGSVTKMCAFKWVQIDEVQDLSDLQWFIVKGLLAPDAHVVYFGDFDQSIFSFMGASHGTLEAFTAGVEVHHLEENFRSPPSLINFFNDYAAANLPSRKALTLRPGSSKNKVIDEGKVKIINVSGEFVHEAARIANRLVPTLISRYPRTAILTRTNGDADTVSEQLRQASIEHFRVSGFDLFSRRVIKDAMAFLRALNSPMDRLAWVRMFVVFGGVTSLRAARELVNDMFDAGMTPLECFKDIYSSSQLRKFLNAMGKERCVLFDTETTGLNSEHADIVQIAAIEFVDGKPTGKEFEVFLHTRQDLSATSGIHGIDAKRLLKDGIEPVIGLQQFIDFCDDSCVAGHNVRFDLAMIASNLSRVGLQWEPKGGVFDTLSLARVLHPRLLNYKLAYLLEALKVDGTNSHNALDDVRATGALAQRLLSDALRHAIDREKILHIYQKYTSRFVANLEPLWADITAMMDEDGNLCQPIDRFFQHAKEVAKYSLEPDELGYVKTLVKFLNLDTKKRSLRKALAQLVPVLSTYSEADLITGQEKVVVSTVHKAKGLEFEAVVVTSCVQDVYPFFYSKTAEKVEEDARLLYVGLTRAKVAIAITTHDESVNKYGKHFSRFQSPFLSFINGTSYQGADVI